MLSRFPRRARLAAPLLTLLAAWPAAAQAPAAGATLPATPSGRMGARVIDALNAPDTTAVARLLADLADRKRAQGAAAEYRALLHRMRAQSGGVSLGEVEPIGDGVGVRLWARGNDGGALLFVSAERADTARLWGLEVLQSGSAASRVRPVGGANEAGVLAAVDAEAGRLAAAGALSGVVLVARGDRVVYRGAFGVADPATGAPVTADTRFHLASTGKMFTAVAVARLVERGRLRWDDRMVDLLPGLPWPAEARAVTLRHLLSHTAGYGSLWDRPGYDPERRYATAGEVVALFAASPPAFAPGSRWSYSNEGFEILAAVVERVTGRPWTAYAAEDVFRRAGMASTSLDDPAGDRGPRATPLVRDADDLLGTGAPRPTPRPWWGGGAGGGYATADDLLRFARAVQGGTLLRPATRDTLTVRRAPLDDGAYGYGTWMREAGGRETWGHGGGGPNAGICTEVAAFADGSWTVVLATNASPPTCHDLRREIVAALARLPAPGAAAATGPEASRGATEDVRAEGDVRP
jgi:CubicO group peptidase (beta-lactamase class C family)